MQIASSNIGEGRELLCYKLLQGAGAAEGYTQLHSLLRQVGQGASELLHAASVFTEAEQKAD